MSARVITPEVAQRIRQMAQGGMTRQETADSLGLNYATLSRFARGADVSFRRADAAGAFWLDDPDLGARLRALAAKRPKRSITFMAEACGISRHLVCQFLQAHPNLAPVHTRTDSAPPDDLAALRDAQRRDYDILRHKGRYSAEQALKAVTRVPVKVRAVPPGAGVSP